MTQPTHLVTSTVDSLNGDPNVFEGLRVTLATQEHDDRTGLDCLVVLHCTPQELLRRYQERGQGSHYTLDEVVEWHGDDHGQKDGFLYAWFNGNHDLTPVKAETRHAM